MRIEHGAEQPGSRHYQHDNETKHHRNPEIAIVLVVRRLRRRPFSALICQSSLRRIEMHLTAIIEDRIVRFRVLFTFLGTSNDRAAGGVNGLR